jgi:uncharacterized membrane protein YcaP (DUF421 family)
MTTTDLEYEKTMKTVAQMHSPWVGRAAVAALLNKSVSSVQRLAATGIWGAPKMVLGSPLWKRERVLQTLENGQLTVVPSSAKTRTASKALAMGSNPMGGNPTTEVKQ